ncbi:hypothetical protein AB0C90_34115 [Streptomyces sp. NPDC048550]|uniref:hypothetical protein n=1 Tax=unclassified Streptomyces TaxID=2593676 RepID=UPI00344126B4
MSPVPGPAGFLHRRLLRGGRGRLLEVGKKPGAGGGAPALGGGGLVGQTQQVGGNCANALAPTVLEALLGPVGALLSVIQV